MASSRMSGASTPGSLLRIARDLRREADRLEFGPPVTHVYDPLDYAWEPHRRYIERYGHGRRPVLLVGMNPGPYGMAQTGVPFGDVAMVRDWMGITGRVRLPSREHPKRPVRGFDCERREVSGSRLWGWARDTFNTPERFFERFFVYNYCPLSFMEETRAQPHTGPACRRRSATACSRSCDRALARVIDRLEPDHVIGIGKFAESRARAVVGGRSVRVGHLLHPSPASPAANRDWAKKAARALREAGIRF